MTAHCFYCKNCDSNHGPRQRISAFSKEDGLHDPPEHLVRIALNRECLVVHAKANL